MYLLFSVEMRQPWPLVRVLLHSSLTSSRVVILSSTDFHMYVLTHVVFSGAVGQELVCNHVTRLLGGKKRGRARERHVKVAV